MEINLDKTTPAEKLNLITILWKSIENKDINIPIDDLHIKKKDQTHMKY